VFGHRYDNETQLYYLQSRYYNPEWGRFINADSVVGETGELLSHNMFAYCSNDPVNNEDSNGDVAWWVGAAVTGAILDSAMYLYKTKNEGFSWSGLGKAAATGALTGIALGGAGKFIAKGLRALVSSKKMSRLLSVKKNKKIQNLTTGIKEWLGDGAKLIKNKNGDTVMLSKDGTKRIRFDINNPSPHENPHGHVEILQNGKWVKSGPIYPNDVLKK
jgi:RHS repeat-associated protein